MSIDIHRVIDRNGAVRVSITDTDGHRTSLAHLTKHQSEVLSEVISHCRMYDKRKKQKDERRAWKQSKKG